MSRSYIVNNNKSTGEKIKCPVWQYDEMIQTGIDYTDIKEIDIYDSQMQKLRDIKKENEDILNYIKITKNHNIIEFGTGTGEFTIDAAQYCSKVITVDISAPMLEFTKKKANMRNISNIEFCNAGFLTYQHIGDAVDAIISQLALHHLPDFWKSIALNRIYRMLKNNGKFYLKDVVYSCGFDNYIEFIDRWNERVRQALGSSYCVNITIREEYPTLDWIMEGLLQKAGFHIEEILHCEEFIIAYKCEKR